MIHRPTTQYITLAMLGLATISPSMGVAASLCDMAPASYVCSPVDYPSASSTRPRGIASDRTIVGTADTPGTVAFTYDGLLFSQLPTPSGASATNGFGINDSGTVVGYSQGSSGFRGFAWDGSTFSTIHADDDGAIEATDTYAYGINNAGDIAGTYVNGSAATGYILSGTTYTPVSVPGALGTYLYGINDSGTGAGTYLSGSGQIIGFTWDGSSFTNYAVAGATQTFVRGINGFGDLVGEYVDAAGNTRGFAQLAGGAGFWTFSVAGADKTFATGINRNREVVGYYTDSGLQYGYLAMEPLPVPLPGSLALLATGLGLLVTRFRATRCWQQSTRTTHFAGQY